MNCKNCKNWVFGRCVVSNLTVGPDVLCNAWELSQSYEMVDMQFATFDEEELHKRIAELEAAGAKLADATQDLINALPLEFSNRNWEIVPVHKALLDWNEISKESEE